MTTTPYITRVLPATILSVAELAGYKGKLKHQITVPNANGQDFPDKYDCEDEALWPSLKAGSAVNLVLKRGNLKRHDPAWDGSRDWMFWESIIGIQGGPGVQHSGPNANPPGEGYLAPAKPAQPQPSRPMPRMDDETTRRITFLSCLNSAATFAATDGGMVKDRVTALASEWADAAFAYGRGEAVDAFDALGPGDAAPPDLFAEGPAANTAPQATPTANSDVEASGPKPSGPVARAVAAAYATPTTAPELKAVVQARKWKPEDIRKAQGGKSMVDVWNEGVAKGWSDALIAKHIWMTLVGALDQQKMEA